MQITRMATSGARGFSYYIEGAVEEVQQWLSENCARKVNETRLVSDPPRQMVAGAKLYVSMSPTGMMMQLSSSRSDLTDEFEALMECESRRLAGKPA